MEAIPARCCRKRRKIHREPDGLTMDFCLKQGMQIFRKAVLPFGVTPQFRKREPHRRRSGSWRSCGSIVRRCHRYPDAVDLHAVICGNQKVSAAVNDPGFNQIAVLRGNGDFHLRGRHFKPAAVDDVRRVQHGVFPVLLFAVRSECFDFLSVHAAVGQNPAHFGESQFLRLRVVALPVILNPCPDLLVDRLHHIIAAILSSASVRAVLKLFFCSSADMGGSTRNRASMTS